MAFRAFPRIGRSARSPRADTARFRLWRPADPDLDAPPQADWAWRPEPWRSPVVAPLVKADSPRTLLGPDAWLHLKAANQGVQVSQIAQGGDLPPFGLSLALEGFDGDYVGLSLDLPAAASRHAQTHHMLHVVLRLQDSGLVAIHCRLNFVRGPNVQQRTSPPLDRDGDRATTDIDFYGLPPLVMPPDRMWLDVIFVGATGGALVIKDIQCARVPRPPF